MSGGGSCCWRQEGKELVAYVGLGVGMASPLITACPDSSNCMPAGVGLSSKIGRSLLIHSAFGGKHVQVRDPEFATFGELSFPIAQLVLQKQASLTMAGTAAEAKLYVHLVSRHHTPLFNVSRVLENRSKLKVVDLKAILTKASLPVSGVKQELVTRILSSKVALKAAGFEEDAVGTEPADANGDTSVSPIHNFFRTPFHTHSFRSSYPI